MSSTQTITSENRRAPRLSTALKTIVQVKESNEESWKEVTAVSTVSLNGAGFTLTRKCEVGRLVSLVLPMPDEFRAYNKDQELYPVLGLVQHCNAVTVDGETVYHVGVGFIGKEMPASFKENPKQNYRFCGMNADGLWLITEAQTSFKARKNARFWKSIEVTISQMKKDKGETVKETAKTKDISSSGISVPCSLDINVGDKVKIASKQFDFYAIAEVRGRKENKDARQPPTLHLQFIEDEFPMNKILFEHAVSPDLN